MCQPACHLGFAYITENLFFIPCHQVWTQCCGEASPENCTSLREANMERALERLMKCSMFLKDKGKILD